MAVLTGQVMRMGIIQKRVCLSDYRGAIIWDGDGNIGLGPMQLIDKLDAGTNLQRPASNAGSQTIALPK